MTQTAIVLAAHGSRSRTASASLAHITERVMAAHPDKLVRVAYTSHAVRGRMKQSGQQVYSVPDALDSLHREQVSRVVIQSLHMIPGMEFHMILRIAKQRTDGVDGFDRIEVGFPLVSGEDGVEEVADAFLAVARQGRGDSDAVLFMGHGTRHDANVYYEALHNAFQQRDPSVHLGAMEAAPGIDGILERFKRDGVKKAYLLPFLFGSGWHVSKDMVGDGADSWKSRLEKAGIQCVPESRGAGEYDVLVDVWLKRLDEALSRLNRD